MEYPTLEQPGVAIPETYHCPFGCKGDETDEKGYCGHLVGFTTDRESLEPLEELTRWSGQHQKWMTTGYLTVNANHREKIQEGDKLVNPIIRETDHRTKQEYNKLLWISWRVYSDNPDREPILMPLPKQTGPRVKNKSFEFKNKAKRVEEQLSAPEPDEDLEVNPRKRARATANKKVQAEATAAAKRRISTASTKVETPVDATVE